MATKDIDIVVVNYKRYDLTKKFIDTFLEFEPEASYTLTVVDNEATQMLAGEDFPCKVLSSSENLGYGGACNWGASEGTAKYIGIFNNDIEWVNNTCLDQCIAYMEENPDVGITGPFQYCTNRGTRKVTNAGIIGPGNQPKHRGWLETDQGQYRFNEEVLMIMGSAMIIRREFWDQVMEDPIFREFYPTAKGAFPDKFTIYYEDTTLCYAAPYFGYKVVYMGEEGCEVIHQWHQTIKDAAEDNSFIVARQGFRDIMNKWGLAHD